MGLCKSLLLKQIDIKHTNIFKFNKEYVICQKNKIDSFLIDQSTSLYFYHGDIMSHCYRLIKQIKLNQDTLTIYVYNNTIYGIKYQDELYYANDILYFNIFN
jgi:hypothetical protein